MGNSKIFCEICISQNFLSTGTKVPSFNCRSVEREGTFFLISSSMFLFPILAAISSFSFFNSSSSLERGFLHLLICVSNKNLTKLFRIGPCHYPSLVAKEQNDKLWQKDQTLLIGGHFLHWRTLLSSLEDTASALLLLVFWDHHLLGIIVIGCRLWWWGRHRWWGRREWRGWWWRWWRRWWWLWWWWWWWWWWCLCTCPYTSGHSSTHVYFHQSPIYNLKSNVSQTLWTT